MRQLVISCSLSPASRSAILATHLRDALRANGDSADLIDLRELNLPFCDADGCWDHPDVKSLRETIHAADAVAIATPVYNFETGGSTRNMIALTGKAWMGKIVGLVAAAGGERSYMSLMPLANSLMLDFRCLVVPRVVYASDAAFDKTNLIATDTLRRIADLASEMHRLSRAALSPVRRDV